MGTGAGAEVGVAAVLGGEDVASAAASAGTGATEDGEAEWNVSKGVGVLIGHIPCREAMAAWKKCTAAAALAEEGE